MDDLELAFKIINANNNLADFEGSKAAALVNKAECRLNLKFPPSYKVFLKKYGCGDFAGEEIFGIINEQFDNAGIPNAIGVTLRLREEDNLPRNLVIFYFDGYENYYAIDCGHLDKCEEGAIVVWHPEREGSGNKLKKVANNFREFFYKKVKQALEVQEQIGN